MIGAGYDLGEIRREWTPALIVRMSQAAARRRAGEWVMLAQVIAAGTGAGFSGDWKPIQALARNLGVPVPGRRAEKADVRNLGAALARFEGKRGPQWR